MALQDGFYGKSSSQILQPKMVSRKKKFGVLKNFLTVFCSMICVISLLCDLGHMTSPL